MLGNKHACRIEPIPVFNIADYFTNSFGELQKRSLSGYRQERHELRLRQTWIALFTTKFSRQNCQISM